MGEGVEESMDECPKRINNKFCVENNAVNKRIEKAKNDKAKKAKKERKEDGKEGKGKTERERMPHSCGGVRGE